MGPGTRVKFSPGATLLAKGALKVVGSPKEPIAFEGQGWAGIRVMPQGRAEISDASLQGCSTCLKVQGGLLEGTSTTLKGPGKTAVMLDAESHFTVSDFRVSGFETGVVLRGGRGKLKKSTITENHVGIRFEGGVIELVHNNIFQNRENEVVATKKLVLENNYLGTPTVEEASLEGDILVASLLNAPYPHGQRVVLVSDKEITPEVMAARFDTHKKQGIEAFKNREFGAAYQSLEEALTLKDAKEVYLYMAYTQMILGEKADLEKTLTRGIEVFPYEVRLYQIYAKYLIGNGEKEEALAILNRALRMNPGNETLKIMKQGLTEPAAVQASRPTAEKPAQKAPPEKPPLSKTPEASFATLKAEGIRAFKAREFKKAAETLTQALSRKADNEVYLYLAYTQMNLQQKVQLEDTLDKGIAAFPEDVRLYQLYAKNIWYPPEIRKRPSP
ncbi:MAG: NosD domain-containing protein [Deltaproteobacteria bacterium]|nr:NosD domain-containing protein [Deltaproteobacteria bacterium]